MVRRFVFRFDRLLSLRRHEEDARRLELGRITGECHTLERQIEDRLQRREAVLRSISEDTSSDIEYRFSVERFAQRLRSEAGQLNAELQQKESERQEAAARYREAKQKVDVLDRLRERRMNAHKEEQDRLEHIRLDEVSQQMYLRRLSEGGVDRA